MYERAKAKIDTVELETLKDNINMDELERLKGYDDEDRCVSRVRYLKDDRVKIVIHPSRYSSRYDDYSSYSEYKQRINIIITAIFNDITILKLKRLDVCIDYMEEFEEMLKLNKVLLQCMEREKKTSKKYLKFTDEKDNQVSSLKWSNDRSCTISIYDKRKESKGLHDYNTRVEYRLFYGNKNYYEDIEKQCIDELVELIGRLTEEEHYKHAIKIKTKMLEKENKLIKNFSSLLLLHDENIFDKEIAYQLYEMRGKTREQAKTIISKFKNNNKSKGINYIKYYDYRYYMDKQRKKIEKFKDC